MMTTLRLAPQMARRLERLTGDLPETVVLELRNAAAKARAAPEFERRLALSKALSDENRLLCLALLKRRETLCACELQAALNLSHATVSHHMAALEEAGLVQGERRGKWRYYRLAEAAREVVP